MRFSFSLLCIAISAVSTPIVARAQDRILVVQVVDTRDRPVPGVVLSTKGEGAVGTPTDISGKTRIRLAPQTRPDSWVSLVLVKVIGDQNLDLVFISPWDGRARVPPFENESENFVPVVVALRIEREKLQTGKALKDSALASLSGRRSPKRPTKKGSEPQ
jgi:hypothetical protein